jgi:hypothetical protein
MRYVLSKVHNRYTKIVQLVDKMNQSSCDGNELEIMNLMWKVSLEVIGVAGLGYPFGCLGDERNEYADVVIGLLYVWSNTTADNL